MSDWWSSDPAPRAPLQVTVNKGGGDWWNNDPTQGAAPGQATFASRFEPAEASQGQQSSFFRRLLLGMQNQREASLQGTTPDISAHAPNLISNVVGENDAGRAEYKDPATGQYLPVDPAKHVLLQDPNEGRFKVFARTPETERGALSNIGQMAMTGMGAGAPSARIAGAQFAPHGPEGAFPVGALRPTSQELAAANAPNYTAFRTQAAGQTVPTATTVPQITGATGQPRYFEGVKPIYKTIEDIAGTRRAPVTDVSLARLRDLKEQIGPSFQSNLVREVKAAGGASQEIKDIITKADPVAGALLSTADQGHQAMLAARDLEQRAAIAGINTGKAGYGGNTENHIRQAIAPILKRAAQNLPTPYTAEELTAIRSLEGGTFVRNILRAVTQLSPSKGILATGLAVGTGGMTAGIGALSGVLLNVLTKAQLGRLQELVASRSPAYLDAVHAATKRLEQAQIAFVRKPSSAGLAAMMAQARQLSNGLTRDGIKVTSGQLLAGPQEPE